MLELLLFLCFALPIAWLVSEFQPYRWISIFLGIAALSIVGLVVYGWAAFTTTFDINVNSGETIKSLLVTVSNGLESDDSGRVRAKLRRFAAIYQPSYESSSIDQVKKFVAQLEVEASQTNAESGNNVGD